MKAMRFYFSVLGLFCSFVLAHAGDVRTGEVKKIEKQLVTIEDFDTGKPVKVRYGDKTKINGTLKEGALVEWEEKGGSASRINIIAEEEEQEIDQKTEPLPDRDD